MKLIWLKGEPPNCSDPLRGLPLRVLVAYQIVLAAAALATLTQLLTVTPLSMRRLAEERTVPPKLLKSRMVSPVMWMVPTVIWTSERERVPPLRTRVRFVR